MFIIELIIFHFRYPALGFQPPRLSFVVELPFWGHVFGHHGSTLSSNAVAFLGPGEKSPRFNFVVKWRCLFGAMFSATTVQLCRRIALPFWGHVFGYHGSTLSSNGVTFLGLGFQSPRLNFVVELPCLFGAVFLVATVQLCRQMALPFWGHVFSRHGSTLS